MIRARHRTILQTVIETGIAIGLRRAFKYTPMPKALSQRFDAVCQEVDAEVWCAIDQVLDVRDEDDADAKGGE